MRFYSLGVLSLCVLASVFFAGCPTVTPPDFRPEASFTASTREGDAPLQVRFTDTSTFSSGSILAWLWDFGDGETATTPNPLHTYDHAGSFDVSLTVTNADGNHTKTEPDYIVVHAGAEFGTIGSAGGTLGADGATITIPPNALTRDVIYHISNKEDFPPLSQSESLQVISDPILISHNNSTDIVSVTDGESVQGAALQLTFNGAIPAGDLKPDKVQILAQLDNGVTLPIVGTISGTMITAHVLQVPAHAVYRVVYRTESFFENVPVGAVAKTPTDPNWDVSWQVDYSQTTLAQLTALRLGTIDNSQSFGSRAFSQQQLDDTRADIATAINHVHDAYQESGMRAPVLISRNFQYSLIFYDVNDTYNQNYTSFNNLVYAARNFGSLVIDPQQLLSVSQQNATSQNQDSLEKFDFPNAFAQALFHAVFAGYDFPDITDVSHSDLDASGQPRAISVMQGIEDGLATYLGQWADGNTSARSFGPNEVGDFTESLFAPFNDAIAGASVGVQDFFFFLQNAAAGIDPLQVIGSSDASDPGLLEAIRIVLEARAQTGGPISFTEAQSLIAQAFSTALRRNTGISLAQAYQTFAAERLFEHGPGSNIRLSDAASAPYMLDEARAGKTSVVTESILAPTDTKDISSSDHGTIRDIPALSTRVIVLHINPFTTKVTLTFNRADWTSDSLGDSLAVTVYRNGEPGVALAPNQDSLTFVGFKEDPNNCLDTLTIIASNTSLSTTNSFSVTAAAVADLNTPEDQVLDQYVRTCDPSYNYELVASGTVPLFNLKTYVLQMTSGVWRGAEEEYQPIWKHYITVIQPSVVTSNTALLTVSGGSSDSGPPTSVPDYLAPFAVATGSTVALLEEVPNQPLKFSDENRTRSEDAILAYSYAKYLDTYNEASPDASWPALLPMTRAAVRAMDTVQDFMGNLGQRVDIQHFVVSGASKRGWTTWLTAATDPRVTAIIPIVADVLNLNEQMQHHFRAYGFYAPSLHDYVEANVFQRLGTDAGNSLLQIVDPFQYRQRLIMPKMIANSTGDQFFLPDSSQFYFNQLPGQNYLYYAPNTDHGLTSGPDLNVDQGTLNSILAYYISFIRNTPRPNFGWVLQGDNQIVVQALTTPKLVRLWQAHNDTARDFRKETIGEAWTSSEITTTGNGFYTGQVPLPARGWTAFFVQLTFPGPDPTMDLDFTFSTQVRVVPDVYPDQLP